MLLRAGPQAGSVERGSRVERAHGPLTHASVRTAGKFPANFFTSGSLLSAPECAEIDPEKSLYIVLVARTLVEMHGGTIHAESAGVGRGSRFIFVIPAIDLPQMTASASPLGTALGQSQTARLLVVDDNTDAANMLASLLQLDGYEVITAESGEEALALVKEYVPVAAILDLGLPGISGYQLAQALRADPLTRAMLLIALTDYGQSKDREQALASGFDQARRVRSLRAKTNRSPQSSRQRHGRRAIRPLHEIGRAHV